MQVLKVEATGLAQTGKAFVQGVTLVAGSDAAEVRITDGVTDTDDDRGGAKALTDESESSDMHNVEFEEGVFVTISGTNAVAYIYIE